MEDGRQMITRSQRGVPVPQGEETGPSGPSAGRTEDARSVTSSRRSQRSTRSSNAARASELRVQTAREEMEAQKKYNDILRAVRVAEMTLAKKQKNIEKIRQQLKEFEDCCSDEYFAALDVCKRCEEEEEELKSQMQLLHVDETFASLDLAAAKKFANVVEESASGLVDSDSDHSQRLSEDEGDFEDAQSKRSDESEYRRMRDRLLRLRGCTPPPVKTQEEVITPTKKEEVKTSEVVVNPSGVEQFAQVLCQALSKVNNSGGVSSNNNTGEKMLARQAMKLELSPFDGNSAEWPVFLQQFQTVSTACGLTDVENLHRLQRSLRGEARESVRALLMSPDNVKKILSVLEKRFGNAEHIIEDIVLQVKNMCAVKEGDYRGLLKLVDAVRNLTETAVTMKCQPYLTNPQLINNIIEKLPAQFQIKWAEKRSLLGSIHPDLLDVASWMESVGDVIGHLYKPSSSSDSWEKKSSPFKQNKTQEQRIYAAVDIHKVKEKKCRVCASNAHHPSKCKKFCEMQVEDRWRWVRTNRYCFACLNFGHSVSECRGKKICGIDGCDKSHHRLLHAQQRLDVHPTSSQEVLTEVISHVVSKGHINLNILPVTLTGPKAEVQTYAMLDPGASLTVIDAQVAEQLGLRGPTIPLTHSGLHAATTVSESRSVEVKVSGGGEGFNLQNVRTVPQLTLPRQSVKRMTMQRWSHLKNLPISYYADARPTILIGQDHADLCNTSELVLGPANAPAAGKTKLGWVLMGRVGASHEHNVSYHIREETEDDLNQLVKYPTSREAFGVKPNVEKPRSREDRRAVKIIEDTLQRVGDKWEYGLLRKEDVPQPPENFKFSALKRLYSMERKMDAEPEFAADYVGKMELYQETGCMRKSTMVEAATETNKTFYLPHFLAINPKNKNKRRFVLDAASKTSGSRVSDHLLGGPDLLTSLPELLFKFREGKILVCADVCDMFHRVLVGEEDAVAQRLLWRRMERKKDPDEWRWVPTKLNVADEMTRDAEECDFSPDSRWVWGLSFLLEEEMWPVEIKPKSPLERDMELKREFVGVATETSPLMESESFSSRTRLIRVTARVLQFGKKTWRKAQRLMDRPWKRWVIEYLPTLQRRTKWMERTEPVKVGDVGVEVDPQQSRNEWKMGRVAAVFPGKDGIVRVVEWKTATGSYRRPVAKRDFFDLRSEEKPVADFANNAAASLGVGECHRPNEE